jgi:hypothetical protein
MSYKRALLLILASGLWSLAAHAQNTPKVAPIPSDPLELVTGQVAAVDAAARPDALQLLEQARNRYAVRAARRAYDLKVSFTVKSGGQTSLDGAWQMEDVFDPQHGLRWTAKAPDGSIFTRLSTRGLLYGEDSLSYVPLRLHEARAALFDPMPSSANVNRSSIRTTTVAYHGTALNCILISATGNGAPTSRGRRWDEAEECIDPQSGLLEIHSQVPGRYYAYDYSNSVPFADRILPRQVVVYEGGSAVSTIAVESLTEITSPDPRLFLPSEEMKSKGRPIVLGGAQRIARSLASNSPAGGAAPQSVCVFGVVTPSGQLMEAHSLQPSNPNSAAAVEDVKQMSFARPPAPGDQPRQYFVFIVERFGAQ